MTMRQRSLKDTGQMQSDSETCERSELTTSHLSISSAEASPAKTLAMQEREPELRANAPACGLNLPGSFASFDHASSSWRTSQRCFLEGWTLYSETWPRAGMMRNGIVFRRQPLAPITSVIESSSLRTRMARETSERLPLNPLSRTGLWPTPVAIDGTKGPRLAEFRRENPSLAAIIHVPIPPSHVWTSGWSSDLMHEKNLRLLFDAIAREKVSGRLNPMWVEWLMGFPIGWTASDVSETQSFPKSQNSSAEES